MENTNINTSNDNSNNTKLIIATVAFVIGLALVTYGIVNVMTGGAVARNPVNDNPTPEEPTDQTPEILATDTDVKDWLTNNSIVVSYLIDYATNFDVASATDANYSDIFGWYFALKDGKEAKNLTDSKYTYEYVMTKEDVETFMRDVFGKGTDVINVNTITLSKDYFSFTVDEKSNYVLRAKATDFTPKFKSELSNIIINSDEDIQVTYGLMDYASTCDSSKEECFTKYRVLKLRKAKIGYNILSCADATTNSSTDNENNSTNNLQPAPDTNTDTNINTNSNTNTNTNTNTNSNTDTNTSTSTNTNTNPTTPSTTTPTN